MSFRMAMVRAILTERERDAGYCQLFAESLFGSAGHYSMYIEDELTMADLWGIQQKENKSLKDFMVHFKDILSKYPISTMNPL